MGESVPGTGPKIKTLVGWAALACLIGGGLLWSLSPLGVELSELKFKTPDVFWKLFPSAPLLLAAGLLGLLFRRGTGRGPAARIGLWVALAGLLLVAAGDVGLYHLGVDDDYIVTAPAYRAFRIGLVLTAAGALLFGASETRSRGLPVWVGLPFAIASLAGLLAFAQDLGPFGAALWAVFGAGWAWLGFGLAAGSFQKTGRPARAADGAPTAAGHRTGEGQTGEGRAPG